MLIDYIKLYGDKPFIWGVNDCCLFSANIIRDYKKVDYASKFRGKYNTRKEAYNLIHNLYKVKDLPNLLTKVLEISPSYNFKNVLPGNFVAIKNKEQEYCIGINYGARSYFKGEERGLFAVPNRVCNIYWNIGEII